MTQARLAARAGIPQAAISAIETGRRDPTIRTMQRIAGGLGISIGTLVDMDPPLPTLDRHAVDAVSKAIVAGTRALPRDHNRLADALAAAARPELEASGVPGRIRARRRGERSLLLAERRFGRATLELILARLEKHMSATTL
jgi:transcriptional regulator with XRE-family HTH domain